MSSTGINGLVDSLTPTVSGSQIYKKHPFDDDSGTEDSSSHLDATHNTIHTTQNTLDNLLSNPLAFQEVEESTTLEDLCQNVSTVSKGCIISLPSQSPIYSRMESLSRRTGAAGRVSPSPSPPKAASPTPIAMGTHNATATPSHKGIGRNGMGSGPTSNPPTPPQAVAQPGLEEGDSEGLSGALNPTADAPDVPASLSAWGLVPMRPVQRSLQELLAQGAHQCPLQPVFRLEKPPADALVFTMAAGAATICNGTIELPKDSYLVCNEACMQLTLQDVSFRGSGAYIVCHGDGAEVRFQNVSFVGCSVIVLSGAKATLDNCTAVDANVFLVASGAHTQVNITRGRIKACGQVAVADCGAEVHMSDVKARSMCIGGVQAAGFGTTLSLLRCDISDAASANSDAVRNWVVRAVWLQGGASGEFNDCQFSNVGCGVTVMDLDTCAEVRDCFAADNDRLGAEVARGATAKFFGSEMSRSRMFKGAYVGGVGTRVTFQHCVFAENQQCALRIDAGAHTTVRACKLIGSRHFHGVDASGAGTRVSLRDCLLSYNGKYGVVATHRAIVQLVACKSVSNTQAGVSAQERGEVHLSEWESLDEKREKIATEGSVLESSAYAEEDEGPLTLTPPTSS